jgi:hypothetical protein
MLGTTDRAVVCCGMAYWLGSYSTDQWSRPRYFTFGVNVKTGQISSAALSLPANQLGGISYFGGLKLSVTVDGKLSLFERNRCSWIHVQVERNRCSWMYTIATI